MELGEQFKRGAEKTWAALPALTWFADLAMVLVFVASLAAIVAGVAVMLGAAAAFLAAGAIGLVLSVLYVRGV